MITIEEALEEMEDTKVREAFLLCMIQMQKDSNVSTLLVGEEDE